MGVTWALEAAVASGDRVKAVELVGWMEALPPGLRPPHGRPRPSGARPPGGAPAEAAFADHAAVTPVSASWGSASGSPSACASTPRR